MFEQGDSNRWRDYKRQTYCICISVSSVTASRWEPSKHLTSTRSIRVIWHQQDWCFSNASGIILSQTSFMSFSVSNGPHVKYLQFCIFLGLKWNIGTGLNFVIPKIQNKTRYMRRGWNVSCSLNPKLIETGTFLFKNSLISHFYRACFL